MRGMRETALPALGLRLVLGPPPLRLAAALRRLPDISTSAVSTATLCIRLRHVRRNDVEMEIGVHSQPWIGN